MKIAIPKPTSEGETRVALIPESVAKLTKAGLEVLVQAGAGRPASYADADYEKSGARVVTDAEALYGEADAVALVHPPGEADIAHLRSGTILISVLNPLVRHDLVGTLADRGVCAISLDLVPRITRAQAMDVLSSMSSIAGYKAVVLAAATLGRIFPMMMTAAGTIKPARVLILGAGVAGLQAIATAKRLGAVVEAFDVRPVVKEQVESLGARFVIVEAPAEDAQDKGGYAKEMSEAYKQKQKETIHQHVKECDVAISTALIPGKPAPKLITAEMVRDMRLGSVIVDLASEAGGNCELTRPGENVVDNGVTIMGPKNLPASVPYHSSQMFSRNLTAFLLNMTKDGRIEFNMEDEIVRDTLVTRDGQVVNARVRQGMGLAALEVRPPEPVGAA
ncbi:MAG TPA: Re/Si-specific NAD(P)(+) transhydrogenase subunit alpha [Phycisphaerae bacterium]|nr:Re/Si-specific NAD(P)(+) transhydrogenase subunit alpha [Phycisphaerae bacterium]